MEKLLKVLIIGSGAREHAFARKVNESPLVDKIFLAPGNGGTETEFTNLKRSRPQKHVNLLTFKHNPFFRANLNLILHVDS